MRRQTRTQIQTEFNMPVLLKNVLAVIAGVVAGSIVNMAIVTIGMEVIPLPEGVDMSDTENLAENFELLQPVNFIAPWLAHALGTFAGAWTAAKLAASRQMTCSLAVAAFFLLGGIAMVATLGGPMWFSLIDLIGAYLPMGYVGSMLALRRHQTPE